MSELRDVVEAAVRDLPGPFTLDDVVDAVRAARPELDPADVATEFRSGVETAGRVERPPAVARQVSPGRFVAADATPAGGPTHVLDLAGWSPRRKLVVTLAASVGAVLGAVAAIVGVGPRA